MRTLNIVGIVALVTVILLIVGFRTVFKLAFGPIHSSGQIAISEERTIEFNQKYEADFAAVFYDVTFRNDGVTLGTATFHNSDWNSYVSVDSSENRIFIAVIDTPNAYVLSFDSNFSNTSDSIYSIDNFNLQNVIKARK